MDNYTHVDKLPKVPDYIPLPLRPLELAWRNCKLNIHTTELTQTEADILTVFAKAADNHQCWVLIHVAGLHTLYQRFIGPIEDTTLAKLLIEMKAKGLVVLLEFQCDLYVVPTEKFIRVLENSELHWVSM